MIGEIFCGIFCCSFSSFNLLDSYDSSPWGILKEFLHSLRNWYICHLIYKQSLKMKGVLRKLDDLRDSISEQEVEIRLRQSDESMKFFNTKNKEQKRSLALICLNYEYQIQDLISYTNNLSNISFQIRSEFTLTKLEGILSAYSSLPLFDFDIESLREPLNNRFLTIKNTKDQLKDILKKQNHEIPETEIDSYINGLEFPSIPKNEPNTKKNILNQNQNISKISEIPKEKEIELFFK